RLVIPDFVPGHRAPTQLLRKSGLFSNVSLILDIHWIPGADKLLDFDGRLEIVRQNLLQSRRRARIHGEQTAVKNQRIVSYLLAVLKTSSPQTDQIEQVVRKAVPITALIRNREAVFFPCLVEQGNDAVMKQVKEFPD